MMTSCPLQAKRCANAQPQLPDPIRLTFAMVFSSYYAPLSPRSRITNRIGVMSNGRLSGIVNTKETNQQELLRLSAKYL